MNLANHLGRVSWAAASKAPPMVYGLVLITVMIPSLPKVEHGCWAIVFYLLTLITLLNKFLILHPMIRFAAVPEQFSRMVRMGFQLSLVFYAATAALVWFAAPFIAQIMRVSTGDIRFVIPLLAAIFMREVGYCIQQALYNTKRIFILEAVFFIGSSIGFIILALNGELTTADRALTVNLIAAAASGLTALWFGFGGAKLWGMIRLKETVELLRYGILTIGIGFSGFLINGNVDVLLIGAIYTPVEVAVYNAAKAVYRMVSALSQAVALVIMPYASRLASEHRVDELKATYEKSIGYVTAILIGVAIIGCVVAGKAYDLLLGDRYAGSIVLFRLLVLSAPFEGLYIIAGNILYGTGAAGPVAIISIIALGVWLVVALPGLYLFAGMGAAVGFVAAMVMAGIAQHILSAKRLDTSAKEVVRRFVRNFSVVLRLNK